jgi:hypothetical protein
MTDQGYGYREHYRYRRYGDYESADAQAADARAANVFFWGLLIILAVICFAIFAPLCWRKKEYEPAAAVLPGRKAKRLELNTSTVEHVDNF